MSVKAAVFYLSKYGEPINRQEMVASKAIALGASDSRVIHVAGGATDKRLKKLMLAVKNAAN
jgi:hypothetical protein